MMELAKEAGVRWRDMADKSEWIELAAKDKARYEREMADYNLPPSELTETGSRDNEGRSNEDMARMEREEQENARKNTRTVEELGMRMKRKWMIHDPNKPKRGVSAFFHWLNVNREVIKEENPSFSFTDVSKEAGARWRDLTDTEKSEWRELAAKDKARYEREMADYIPPQCELTETGSHDNEGGSNEDEEMARREREEQENARKNMRTVEESGMWMQPKWKNNDPNKPKRGKSAYLHWLDAIKIVIKEENPSISIMDLAKEAGARWHQLTDKSEWIELAAKDKARYEREMADYNPPTST